MFMMIFGGFVMNLTEDVPTAVFFLILSCLCICGNYYLAQDASRVIEVKTQVLMEGSMADGGGESPVAIKAQWALGRVLMKGRLSWLLLVLYPMFVGAYALRLFHYISNDVFWVANLGFSVLAKLVFVGVLSLERYDPCPHGKANKTTFCCLFQALHLLPDPFFLLKAC